MRLFAVLGLLSSALHGQPTIVAGPILANTGTVASTTPTYKTKPDASAIRLPDNRWVFLDGQNMIFADSAGVPLGAGANIGISGGGYPIAAKTLWQYAANVTFSGSCFTPSCDDEPKIFVIPSHTLSLLNASGGVDSEDRIGMIASLGDSGCVSCGTFLFVSSDLTHAADLSTWKGSYVTTIGTNAYYDGGPSVGFKANIGLVIGSFSSAFKWWIFVLKWSDVLWTSGSCCTVTTSTNTNTGFIVGCPMDYFDALSNSDDIACAQRTFAEAPGTAAMNFATFHVSPSWVVSAGSALASGLTYQMQSQSGMQQNGNPAGSNIEVRHANHLWYPQQMNGSLYFSIETMFGTSAPPADKPVGQQWFKIPVSSITANAPTVGATGNTFLNGSSSTPIASAQMALDSNETFYLIGSSASATAYKSGVVYWKQTTDSTLQGPITIATGTQVNSCNGDAHLTGLYLGGMPRVGSAGHMIAITDAATNVGNCLWTWQATELSLQSVTAGGSSVSGVVGGNAVFH